MGFNSAFKWLIVSSMINLSIPVVSLCATAFKIQ
jgi:hypothetical protein